WRSPRIAHMTTVAILVQSLCQSRLLDPGQLDKLTRQLQHRFADPQALADDLIRRGWLTPQQILPLMQNGSAQPMSYGERRAASRRRWFTFNIVGALVIVVLGGVIFYVIKHD